jgi:hypothetical protein
MVEVKFEEALTPVARLWLLSAVAGVALSVFAAAGASAAAGLGVLSAGHLRVTRVIVRPKRDALLTRAPVRLVLRLPSGMSGVRVTLNSRRVSGRLLGAGAGLRPGLNRLLVRGTQAGRVVAEARSFAYVRPSGSLGRLRVQVGAGGPTDVGVTVLARGLDPARRPYVFRAWLNGREVTRYFDGLRRPTWTASLSVSHGVRSGTNRLRLLLADPGAGRYVVLTRPFRMPAAAPLAGAGPDQRVLSGMRVRLDGRASRSVGGERLGYRWTLVGRPKGSRARLLGVTSVRPTLTTDRPGVYRARLRVTSRGHRGRSSGSLGSTADEVSVMVKPSNPLIPFATNVQGGVEIGSQVYPNPTAGGVQVLTVNRSTLAVTNSSYTNAQALRAQLNAEGLDQLVIIAAPGGGSQPPVRSGDVGTFNRAMNFMGVSSLNASTLTTPGQELSIIGVPRAAAGSGWFSPAGHTGWLAADTSDRYTFSPATPAVNTSSSASATQNTMAIAGQALSATASVQGGYQVVALDPRSLKVVASGEFDTDPASQSQMAAFLNARGVQGALLIAVQSIGNVAGIDPGSPVGVALEKLGGAAPVMAAGGSYALFGGTALTPGDVLETSGSVVTDPTTNTTMGSSLLARAVPRHVDGIFHPTAHSFPGAAQPAADVNFGLYDIVHQPATPWPYTTGGSFPQQPGCGAPGSDPAGYAAALSRIAQGVGLGDYAQNLRNAYVQNDQATWSDEKVDLAGLSFQSGNGYTADQWCNLKAELQHEWDWLDQVKSLLDAYKQPFLRSGASELIDLQTLGDDVKNSVHPNGSATVGWDVFSVIGEVANVVSFFPEEGAIGALIDSIQSAYDLSSEFATGGGSPLPDQVDSKVQALSEQVAAQYSDVAASMDNLRDVVISDYGRLSTLGPLAPTPDWAIDSGTIEQVTQELKTGAQGWFSEQLLPLAWKAFTLAPIGTQNPNPTTSNCSVTYGSSSSGYTTNFASEPASGQVLLQPRVVALGRGNPNDVGIFDSFSVPPATLTDPLFASPNQNGLGLYKPWFFLRNFSPFGQADCIDTAPG